jgi:hypothetical protein
MPKIKHKHINYFKQYLEVAMCPISPHSLDDMKILEITTIKPLTPQQARIDGLKRQKEASTKALQAERDRQKVAKAQQTIANTKNNQSTL